jgi:hypothetical protein
MNLPSQPRPICLADLARARPRRTDLLGITPASGGIAPVPAITVGRVMRRNPATFHRLQ